MSNRVHARLFNVLSTFALTIIVVALGNISIVFELGLEGFLIQYSFLAYIVSNWIGLNDLFLTPVTLERTYKKLILDYFSLIVLSIILGYMLDGLVYSYLAPLALILYPAYLITYFLRRKCYYFTSFAYIFLTHVIVVTGYVFNLLVYECMAIIFLFSVPFILFAKRLFSESRSVLSGDEVVYSLYYKLFITGIVFGELDRYIIAFFLDAKIAILYATLNTILGFIPGVYVASMQSHINDYLHTGCLVRFSQNMSKIFFTLIAVSIGITFLLGYEFYSILAISIGLSIKFYFVLRTISTFVVLYAENKVDKIYKLNLKINLLGLIVNLAYLIFPAAILITTASKLASALPLYWISKVESKKSSKKGSSL